MLAGWVPPGGSEGESVPRFSRSFSLAAALGLPCVQLHNFDLSAPHDMAFLPVYLCVSKLPSSFFFFFFNLYLFDCIRSQLWRADFSRVVVYGLQSPQVQQLQLRGLVALWHVGP